MVQLAAIPVDRTGTSAGTGTISGFTTFDSGASSTSTAFNITASGYLTAKGPSAEAYGYVLQYTANGNLYAAADDVNGLWVYSYDTLNRLVGAKSSNGVAMNTPFGAATSQAWTYDSFGNRISETDSAAATVYSSGVLHYDATNRMSANQGVIYDAAGNVRQDANNKYLYDSEGRLCAVATNYTNSSLLTYTQYVYDAEGNRTAKGSLAAWPAACAAPTAANGFTLTAQYLRGAAGDQDIELDGSGAWQHTNVFSGGGVLATYTPASGACMGGGSCAIPPELHYQYSDWLGTRRLQTNSVRGIEGYWKSDPFGEYLSPNSNGDTEHHFTGKERDAESGNDYFGARYYASTMGRWLSPDWSAKVMPVPYAKLDNPQSLNLYAYVGNNPLSRTDPTGHYLCNGKECNQVKAALQTAQKAIDSGNLSKDEVKALKGVISFYGKEGKDNGVTVNTGVAGLTSEGGVGKTVTENGKTTISLNMGALDKTVNQGSPAVEKSAAVVHEGEHGVQNLANGSPTTPDQWYASEQKSYTVQSYVNKGMNSDSDRNLWTTSGGFNQNAVNENAADSTRLDVRNPNWRSPDE